MSDLIAFLGARIDEDSRHLRTQRPLREVAAKREIILLVLGYEAKIDGEWGCCHSATEIAHGECEDIKPEAIPALLHIAAVYADHPDYDPAWMAADHR